MTVTGMGVSAGQVLPSAGWLRTTRSGDVLGGSCWDVEGILEIRAARIATMTKTDSKLEPIHRVFLVGCISPPIFDLFLLARIKSDASLSIDLGNDLDRDKEIHSHPDRSVSLTTWTVPLELL
jgi:hypothetical protein